MSFGRRDPFDERCCCDHETETHHCLCMKKVDQAKDRCSRCANGHHVMRKKDRPPSVTEALQVLSSLDKSGVYDD